MPLDDTAQSAKQADSNPFRFPNDSEHIAIFGRNGTGKSHFATWMLSERSWNKMPWIILNTKRDELIEEIPGSREMGLNDSIPSKPGVYVITALIVDDEAKEKLNEFYMRCWKKGNVGVYVDEGYVSSGLKGFRACMTQGRALRVPLMVLSQRPVWMDRFLWSESSLYIAFDLNLDDDRDTANKMIPGYRQVSLQPHHALFHDVKAKRSAILTPCPDRDSILASFRSRSGIRRKAI